MTLIRAKVLLFSVAAIALFAVLLANGVNGQKVEATKVVEAKILVNKRGSAAPHADEVPIHLVVLKSRGLLERAIKKGDLASLKALAKSGDPVAALQSGLGVPRDSPTTSIMTLTFRGASAEAGAKILAAVVAGYEEFLNEKHRRLSEEWIEQMTKTREMLRRDIAGIHERKVALLSQNTKGDLGIATERLKTLEHKKTELLIRETEIRVALKRAEGNASRPGLQIEAHAWAAKIGFDKLPKSVQALGQVAAYKEDLKEKGNQLAAFRTEMDAQIDKERDQIRKAAVGAKMEEALRAESVSAKKLLDITTKVLSESIHRRDEVRYLGSVLSAPKGFKLPKSR